ncbi:hypothetical protein JDV02_002952 [Purpureocillium takamizusanense]|uniref:Uncharacterized protein n=1 Tax=Purpureocillium takamizusanense TaxID=2060973 RepID=A0A9Q8Q9P2_9HYPO|nr:uncharacterized protein JDV02_002952 [Purpureocillium takamizusanense]UNI16524.1 hypothetical protein JDV02_002952 [Purpureocillium takamizusanense]
MKLTLFSIAALCAPVALGGVARPFEMEKRDLYMLDKHTSAPCQLALECEQYADRGFKNGGSGSAISAKAGDAKADAASSSSFAEGNEAEYARCAKQIQACGLHVKKIVKRPHHKPQKAQEEEEEEDEGEKSKKHGKKKSNLDEKKDEDEDEDNKGRKGKKGKKESSGDEE